MACTRAHHAAIINQSKYMAVHMTRCPRLWVLERTLMLSRGGWIGKTVDLNFSSPKTWADSVHWSDRWWWPVRPVRHWTSQETPVRSVRLTGQTGVAQSSCKTNFKHLLTSSTNQTWWVAFVNDHKKGNEPCTHKQVSHSSRSKQKQIKYARKELREATHTKKQGFVSRSSPPTKERLRLH
jgi:hypothetical protein